MYKTYEGNDYDILNEVLSTLKWKRIKINSVLFEKYKDILQNPDFEQVYYSGTAIGIYIFGHDSNRIMKWLAYYDRFFK